MRVDVAKRPIPMRSQRWDGCLDRLCADGEMVHRDCMERPPRNQGGRKVALELGSRLACIHVQGGNLWPGPSVPKGETGHTTVLRSRYIYWHCFYLRKINSGEGFTLGCISTDEPARTGNLCK